MSEEDRGGCFEMSMVEPRPLDSVFASGGAGVSEVGIMAAPTTLFELRWTLSQVGRCLKRGLGDVLLNRL